MNRIKLAKDKKASLEEKLKKSQRNSKGGGI